MAGARCRHPAGGGAALALRWLGGAHEALQPWMIQQRVLGVVGRKWWGGGGEGTVVTGEGGAAASEALYCTVVWYHLNCSLGQSRLRPAAER